MKVYYDDSYAGAGKTEQAIKNMVKAKRKTLFFTERIESFDELERRINKQAGIDGTAPIIDKVYSSQTDRLGSVSRQIEALPERHQAVRFVAYEGNNRASKVIHRRDGQKG